MLTINDQSFGGCRVVYLLAIAVSQHARIIVISLFHDLPLSPISQHSVWSDYV